MLSVEITYELHIRGLLITSNLHEKRALLRDALRLERTEQSQPPVAVILEPV